jgi:hypothetical protein
VATLLPTYIRFHKVGSSIASQNYLFIYLTFISVIIFGFGSRSVPDRIKLLLIGFSVLSYLTIGDQYNFFTWNQLISFNCALVLFFQIYSHEIDKNVIIKYLGFSCLIQSLWVVSQYFGLDPYRMYAHYFTEFKVHYAKDITLMGSQNNTNTSSALIAILSPFMLSGWMSVLLVFPIIAIYLLDSTMGTLAMIFGVLVFAKYSFFKKVKISYVVGLFALAVACCYYFKFPSENFASDSHRFKAWKEMFEWVSQDSFLEGKGFSSLRLNAGLFKLPDSEGVFAQAHNEYLETFINFGAIGLCVMGYLIFIVLNKKNFSKNIVWMSSFSALLFNSIGNFPLHIAASGYIAILLYAILLKGE